MHICVITPDYPAEGRPVYPFVQNICKAFAEQGNKVSVITSQNLKNILLCRVSAVDIIRHESVKNGELTIYAPYNITGYSIPVVGSIINRISGYITRRYMRKHHICPDVFYSHFWRSGLWMYTYAKALGKPLFVASGESTIKLENNSKFINDYCQYVNGVVCVSTKNKNESIAKGLAVDEKCIILPNAIDERLFRVMDKKALRMSLGCTEKDFIVAFVGYYCNRKGSKRLSDAISLLKDNDIKSFFLGAPLEKGCEPDCPNILFKGEVSHEKVPEYLNCADIFVLPTLHEGCANAIVEAMACGLPIVSSFSDFNLDILDDTCSILVDPNSINEIANAINNLKLDTGLRKRLSEGALKKADSLKISNRANNIISFMQKQAVEMWKRE